MRCLLSLLVMLLGVVPRLAAAQTASAAPTTYLLRPARVFDGVSAKAQEGWVVLVQGERITAAGPAAQVKAPAGAEVIDPPCATWARRAPPTPTWACGGHPAGHHSRAARARHHPRHHRHRLLRAQGLRS